MCRFFFFLGSVNSEMVGVCRRWKDLEVLILLVH